MKIKTNICHQCGQKVFGVFYIEENPFQCWDCRTGYCEVDFSLVYVLKINTEIEGIYRSKYKLEKRIKELNYTQDYKWEKYKLI